MRVRKVTAAIVQSAALVLVVVALIWLMIAVGACGSDTSAKSPKLNTGQEMMAVCDDHGRTLDIEAQAYDGVTTGFYVLCSDSYIGFVEKPF